MAYIAALLFMAMLVAADQFSKYLVIKHIFPIGSYSVVHGVLNLTYVENTGAAFGIFPAGGLVFLILSGFIIAGVCVYYVSLPKGGVYKKMRFALVLVLAGAVGNFIDRIRYGYVVDYLHLMFIDFPVFNVADMLIVLGTIFLAVLLFFFVKSEPA